MRLSSSFLPLCAVQLPYAGRQHYMHAFDLAAPSVPVGFEDYLEPVRQLVAAAGRLVGTAFLTVDEKIVQPGMSQRRPGPHVDGCFMPAANRWGGHPHWNHHCNEVPLPRMSVIVAASVVGCKAWTGEFEGEPRNDGDLSHLSLPEPVMLAANHGFLLSPDCIHESMIFDQPTQRSFMRIALPVEAS